VVHLVPNMLECQLAVIIVCVEILSHWFVEAGVQEAEESAARLGSLSSLQELDKYL